ncbi:MAG: hypothetical protein ACQESG_03305 [Nanobdellota archaeon]
MDSIDPSDKFIDSMLAESPKDKKKGNRKSLIIMGVLYIVVALVITHVFLREYGTYEHLKRQEIIGSCNKLNDTERRHCYENHINNATRSSQCTKIFPIGNETDSIKDECYLQVSKNTQDLEPCQNIRDLSQRVVCKQQDFR